MFVETKREGEAPVKIEPSLPDFIRWLETKNPDETYNWGNIGTCACSQYFASVGSDYCCKAAQALDHIAMGVGARVDNWTFGKLLDRARVTFAFAG